MVLNRKMNLTNLINSSLEIIYDNTMLSNHDLIRFKKIRLEIIPGDLWNEFCQLSIQLLISGQTFKITVAMEFFF